MLQSSSTPLQIRDRAIDGLLGVRNLALQRMQAPVCIRIGTPQLVEPAHRLWV